MSKEYIHNHIINIHIKIVKRARNCHREQLLDKLE